MLLSVKIKRLSSGTTSMQLNGSGNLCQKGEGGKNDDNGMNDGQHLCDD